MSGLVDQMWNAPVPVGLSPARGSRTGLDRVSGAGPHHGGPLSNAPSGYQPGPDIRIGSGKRLGDLRAGALKEEDGSIHRVRQGAAQQQFTPFDCLSAEREMVRPQRSAALDVIRYDIVDEQVVHAGDGIVDSADRQCRTQTPLGQGNSIGTPGPGQSSRWERLAAAKACRTAAGPSVK